MKQLIAVAIISMIILVGCNNNLETKEAGNAFETPVEKAIEIPVKKKQLSEQELALQVIEVQSEFSKEFGISKEAISAPITYDINNDGSDEIVLYTEKELGVADHYYIGIYDLYDGSKLVANKYDSADAIRISIISNETYKNALAVLSFGGTAAYTVDVMTLKDGSLISIASISSEFGDPEGIITDIDEDGFHEFKGMEYDFGPGSDRLSRAAGVIDDVIYSWDASAKMYKPEIYGEDGITDKQRNSEGELTKEKAVRIVQAAYDLQLSWKMPIESEDEIHKLLRPFFSNNFIYEYMQEGVFFSNDYNGYLTKYSETGDYSWLIPSYTSEAQLEFSEDGVYAYLTQSIEQGYEGESYKVQANATLVKTEYGWKIDGLGINESNEREESSSVSNLNEITIGDSENQLLEAYGYDTPKELREGYTIYTISKTQFYVDFVVKAIISEDESYSLSNGISLGDTLKHVLDTYNSAEFRNWEDSRIITSKVDSGLIVGFDFGMGGGDLVSDDSILKIVTFDDKFFETIYSETYEEKMKQSSSINSN